jgi:glycosyltransferase involved in cell wall biosynthesis
VRIVFVNSARASGRGADSTIELGRGLAQREHDITVVCHPGSAIRERLGTAPRLTVAPVAIHTDFNPYRVLQLARVIHRVRPDIVIAYERVDVTLSVAARRFGGRFPIVHRCGGVPSQFADSIVSRRTWGRELQTVILKSHAMRDQVLQTRPWMADVRLEVIPDGIDTNHYRPLTKLRRRMRTELGIPDDAFVVSYHGAVEESEHLDLLVRAVAELPRHLNALALMLGAGPLLAETRGLATELRAPVVFAGNRADIPAVLSAADVAAMLSTGLVCSSSLIESLACGLPVIATDADCHPEQVEDGVQGMLVPPQDWNSLADAIRWLSGDPAERQRMAKAARERAVADFSLERMIGSYEEVLQQTVDAFGGTE